MTGSSGESHSRTAERWWDIDIEEVAAGVYRLPLPLPEKGLNAINVYALTHDDSTVTLVDAGADTAESRTRLAEGLAQLGSAPEKVRAVYVSHVHYDHYSQAVALQRDFGTRILLGSGEREGVISLVQAPVEMPDALGLRLLTGGLGRDVEERMESMRALPNASWSLPSEWITEGMVVDAGRRSLTAVLTPGHTRGHMVFHDESDGIMFTGDHILPTISPSVGFEPVPAQYPLRDYLNSLEAVSELPDAAILPAHGPTGSTTHLRIAELLAHHDDRLGAVLETVRAGARSALDTADELPWRTRRVPFSTLEGFDRFLAVNETLAHLDVLVDRGLLSRTLRGGVWIYNASPMR